MRRRRPRRRHMPSDVPVPRPAVVGDDGERTSSSARRCSSHSFTERGSVRLGVRSRLARNAVLGAAMANSGGLGEITAGALDNAVWAAAGGDSFEARIAAWRATRLYVPVVGLSCGAGVVGV